MEIVLDTCCVFAATCSSPYPQLRFNSWAEIHEAEGPEEAEDHSDVFVAVCFPFFEFPFIQTFSETLIQNMSFISFWTGMYLLFNTSIALKNEKAAHHWN